MGSVLEGSLSVTDHLVFGPAVKQHITLYGKLSYFPMRKRSKGEAVAEVSISLKWHPPKDQNTSHRPPFLKVPPLSNVATVWGPGHMGL